jgi:prepilin-type N-terminal cleavage/methylation domain-containing protein
MLKVHTKKGFTLIEIAVTIGIVGVMIAMYFGVVSSMSLARLAKEKDLALKIATHKVEELRASGYALLPTNVSFSDSLLSSLPSGSGQVTVSTYNAQTKQVTVTVTWSGGSNGNRSVAVSTLITQSGGL